MFLKLTRYPLMEQEEEEADLLKKEVKFLLTEKPLILKSGLFSLRKPLFLLTAPAVRL